MLSFGLEICNVDFHLYSTNCLFQSDGQVLFYNGHTVLRHFTVVAMWQAALAREVANARVLLFSSLYLDIQRLSY
ncbi:Ribonuclease [Trichinella pseudospiralis]